MSTALVVVDVQQDFCEGGALAVAGGNAVAEAIAELLADARGGYQLVVATRDAHVDPGDHFSDDPDFASSWPRHCVVGTPGQELHPALAGFDFDAVVDKGAHEAAYSGFEGHTAEGTGLADWLRTNQVTHVDVVGIATDHCVRATALDASREEFATRVLVGLTAAVDPQNLETVVAELGSHGVGVA